MRSVTLRTTTIDLSTKPANTSRVWSSSPSAHTPWAASRSNDPANTDNRAKNTCSASVSKRYDQSIVATKLCWRGNAPRTAPRKNPKRSNRRTTSAALITRIRAAANSTPNGRQSTRRQISATAGDNSAEKPGALARARSTNNRVASSTDSGATVTICSPTTPNGCRLVATIDTPGHCPTIRSTSPAAASTTCSQLSSTTNAVRERKYSITDSSTPSPCC